MGLQLDDQDDLGPGKCTQIEVLSSVTGIKALNRNVAVPSSFVGLSGSHCLWDLNLRYASKKTLHTVVSRRRRKTPHYTILSPLLNRCKTAVECPEFAQWRLALKTAVKRSLSPLSPALKRR